MQQLWHWAACRLQKRQTNWLLCLCLCLNFDAQGLARRTPWRVPQGTGGSTIAPSSSCSTLWKRGVMRPVSPFLSACSRYSSRAVLAKLSLNTTQMPAGGTPLRVSCTCKAESEHCPAICLCVLGNLGNQQACS